MSYNGRWSGVYCGLRSLAGKWAVFALVGFLSIVMSRTAVFAQAGRASILGSVTDASGAAVPRASVTIVNIGTRGTRTVTTNGRGDYEAGALDIGMYEVSTEVAGFHKQVVSGIRLEIDQLARVDLKLQVGELTQVATVEGSAPLVQTDDATLSTRIDEAMIRELPIAGNRNLYQLALLAPGMSTGSASSVTTGSLGIGFGLASMGQKVANNLVLLDGAPIRQNLWAILNLRPSVEALEEFRVESGWYSAEYGTQSGAQIIATIRPGTNNFHGVAFEFLRNDKLDAHNFFDKPGGPKKPLRRNTFGGVVSGPIIRNKTFFTVNTEIYRERRTAQAFGTVPSAQMESGNLTEPYFHNASGGLIPIVDPASGYTTPFPNNLIPASRLSPISKNFYQFYPAPNYGAVQFNGQVNYSGVTKNPTNDNQFFLRIDHTFGVYDKLFGRVGIENVDLSTVPVIPNPLFVQLIPKHQRNATVNWKRIISPTVLNEFKVSYNRDVFKMQDAVVGTDFDVLKVLGIPGQVTSPASAAVPNISITGLTGFGSNKVLRDWEETYQFADSLSIVRGNHSLKIGTEWTHVRVDFNTQQYLTGGFTFTGINAGLGAAAADIGHLGWADFLLDQPSTVYLNNAPPYPGFSPGSFQRLRNWRWNSYVTDDWKLTPRLTMNIGLRYEYNSVWHDIRGASRNLDFNTWTLFPAPGVTAGLHDPQYHNFAPRLGLAWRPFGGTSTVIHVAYGLFYNINMVNALAEQLGLNVPFGNSQRETNSAGNVVIHMSNADQAASLLLPVETLAIPKNFKLGMVNEWNFNIQRALPGNMAVEIGYVGSKSQNFDRTHEYNDYIPGTTIRPVAALGAVEMLSTDASGTYQGLLAKFEKRLSHGFTFLQTYTWSHTLFDSLACCGASRPSNPFDLRAEKGNAETDIRHRATTLWLYDVPWYKNGHNLAGTILGHWQVNGTLTMQTGLPMNVIQSVPPLNDGCPRCAAYRPDRVGNGVLSGDQRTLNQWFNTAAFTLAQGHYGNSGRNVLTAPGLVVLNFSLFKNFPVMETRNIQFRWEMYNATNTPPFQPPTLDLSSGSFGRITSAGVGREMQVGLRFEF